MACFWTWDAAGDPGGFEAFDGVVGRGAELGSQMRGPRVLCRWPSDSPNLKGGVAVS